jgi:hypothetical protein
MDCQNCGARREAGVQDVMPSDVDAASKVTDPEMLKQAKAGEHWECEYCGGQTRDLYGNCQNCGGDREDLNVQLHREEPGDIGGTYSRRRVREPTPVPEPLPLEVSWLSRHKRKVIIGGCAVVGLAGLTWLLLYLFVPREVHAMVDRIGWKTETVLKQRVTRSGEGWGYPAGAFDTNCHRRQRGTERCRPYKCNQRQESYNCRPHQCNCSTQCTTQKNGYSKCRKVCSTCYDKCSRTVYDTCYHQCPVYDDWCTYKYYEWVVIHRKVASGRDHKVYWPKIPMTEPHQRIENSQRYEVCFRRERDLWTHHPKTLAKYKKYAQNDPWLIKVNRAGQVWPLQKVTAEQE